MAATVVVGVDSSPSARAALTWAATWATLAGAQVRAIHVITPTLEGSPTWYPGVPGWPSSDRDSADGRERAEVAAMCDAVQPRARWTLETVRGPVGSVLVEAAGSAELLVVGTRRLRGLSRVLEGSVSEFCLRHAEGPVIVVPAAPVPSTETAPSPRLAGARR